VRKKFYHDVIIKYIIFVDQFIPWISWKFL